MRDFNPTEIQKIKSLIAQKKEKFGQDWLGRSLAYTPYQPRPLSNLLRRDKNEPLKRLFALSPNEQKEQFLRDAKEYEKTSAAFLIESLEDLTYLRRYVQIPLIYDFLILDSYQLLESLVYGADCITLAPKYLSQKELNALSDYALKLGLERIFQIDSKEDLTKAIFAKADILNLNKNFALLSLVPKNKIILESQKNAISICAMASMQRLS